MFWCFLFDQFSFFPGYNMMIPPFSWGNTAIFHVFRSSPPVSPRPAAVWGVDGNHFWALAAWEIRNHFPWQPGMEHRHGTFISRFFFIGTYLYTIYIYTIYTIYILYIYIRFSMQFLRYNPEKLGSQLALHRNRGIGWLQHGRTLKNGDTVPNSEAPEFRPHSPIQY